MCTRKSNRDRERETERESECVLCLLLRWVRKFNELLYVVVLRSDAVHFFYDLNKLVVK